MGVEALLKRLLELFSVEAMAALAERPATLPKIQGIAFWCRRLPIDEKPPRRDRVQKSRSEPKQIKWNGSEMHAPLRATLLRISLVGK
jgi:hypothetical protein